MNLYCGILKTLLLLVSIQVCVGYKRICYYTNWAQYRNGAKFFPRNIPANLCTHIFYAFATLSNNNIVSREWNDDSTAWSQGMYDRINALKSQNPELKVLVSIGGWISADEPTRTREFRLTANSAANRTIFIQNAIKYIRDRNLDGLDIDWEYPRPEDSHLQLMKELREEFDAEGQRTQRQPLQLAAAVWGNAQLSGARYNMAQLGRYMDIIGIMSYDYYGHWDPTVNQHSILYPETDDAVNLWLSNGFPANKLVIGIATYGRSFTLASETATVSGSAAIGAGLPGQFTNSRGVLSYMEICLKIKNDGWTNRWDSVNEVPYAFKGNQWVGYDNKRSVEMKMNYIIRNGLGGAMVWTLDFDDFSNQCGQGMYPLIGVMENLLPSDGFGPVINNDHNTEPETHTTTTTTTTTTTKAPINDPSKMELLRVDCSDPNTPDGFYIIPYNCGSFIRCVLKNEYILECPGDLVYDPAHTACNWPQLVTRPDC